MALVYDTETRTVRADTPQEMASFIALARPAPPSQATRPANRDAPNGAQGAVPSGVSTARSRLKAQAILALRAIDLAGDEGLKGSSVASAAELTSTRALAVFTRNLNIALRDCGLDPEDVFEARSTRDGSLWFKGPKLQDAVEKLSN